MTSKQPATYIMASRKNEFHPDFPSAILREKRIKGWKREWKIRLIEAGNPYWRDLWPDVVGSASEQDTGFRPTPE